MKREALPEMTGPELDAVSGGSVWSWICSWFTPANSGPLDCSKQACEALVVKG